MRKCERIYLLKKVQFSLIFKNITYWFYLCFDFSVYLARHKSPFLLSFLWYQTLSLSYNIFIVPHITPKFNSLDLGLWLHLLRLGESNLLTRVFWMFSKMIEYFIDDSDSEHFGNFFSSSFWWFVSWNASCEELLIHLYSLLERI